MVGRGDPVKMPMGLVRRAVIGGGLAALSLLLFGATAAAHAQLISVSPADGEVLDVAPAEVVLTFSEPVSLTGGSVRVLDDDAEDVATGTAQENETVVATLADGLADGTYTVVFEIISVDSHRISGASVFHVGAPTSEGLTGDALDLGGDEAGWGVRAGAAILSAIGYAGALVAAGTLCFSLYADRRADLRAVTSRAAVLGAVALVAAVPFRIARLGGGLDALRDDDVLMAALRGPVGISTAVTANALLVVAVLVDRRARRWLALVVAAVALAGFTIEGHTRATSRRWAMIASDFVHLAAASVWLGGIVALVAAFRTSRDTGKLAAIVRRFSDSAIVAVGVVAATGVTMAWIILPSVGELTSTGYGLALILKVVLVLVVIALGAFNRYRLVPAVESRRQSSANGNEASHGDSPSVARQRRPRRARPAPRRRRRHGGDGHPLAAELGGHRRACSSAAVGDRHVGRRHDGRRHRDAGSSRVQRHRRRAARSRGPHRQPVRGTGRRTGLGRSWTSVRYNPRSSHSGSAVTRRPPICASPVRGTSPSAYGSASSSRCRAVPP